MDVKYGTPLASMRGMAATQLRDAVKMAKTVDVELRKTAFPDSHNSEPSEVYRPSQSQGAGRQTGSSSVKLDTADRNTTTAEFEQAFGGQRVRAIGKFSDDAESSRNLMQIGNDGENITYINSETTPDGMGTEYTVNGTSMGPMVALERNGVLYAQWVEGKSYGNI